MGKGLPRRSRARSWQAGPRRRRGLGPLSSRTRPGGHFAKNGDGDLLRGYRAVLVPGEARGKELFFLSRVGAAGRRSMMAVDIAATPFLRVGRPKALFDFDPTPLGFACTPVRCYDVAPDGQRYFATRRLPTPPEAPVTHINLIPNWFEELKAKVPAR